MAGLYIHFSHIPDKSILVLFIPTNIFLIEKFVDLAEVKVLF